MADITLVYWNVQNFGQGRAIRGNYAGLCNFIATVIKECDASLFAMVELQETGVPYLNTLHTAICNATGSLNWRYDYIKGATHRAPWYVNSYTPDDLNEARLAWTGPANHEGYAVFWRDDLFNLSQLVNTAGQRQSASGRMRLVTEGLVAADDPNGIYEPGLDNTNNPVQDNLNFPSNQGNAWYYVNSPQGWTYSNTITNQPDGTVQHAVRRPAYFIIQANNISTPVILYHAPYGHNWQRQWGGVQVGEPALKGTQLMSFSAPLHNYNRVIAVGDFNIDYNIYGGAGTPVDPYAYFLSDPQNRPGFANCSTFNLPQGQGTMVNYGDGPWGTTNGGYNEINSDNVVDYSGPRYDNLFHKGFMNPDGGVYDVISESVAEFIDLYGGVNNELTSTIAQSFPEVFWSFDVWHPIQSLQNLATAGEDTNPLQLDRTDWMDGRLPDLQKAAEFLRKVISDHQPLTFTFDI